MVKARASRGVESGEGRPMGFGVPFRRFSPSLPSAAPPPILLFLFRLCSHRPLTRDL